MEVLLSHFGTDWKQVDEICLAGGFGFHVDLEKMIALGMFPEEARGKIKVLGNTSLQGAVACLFRKMPEQDLRKLQRWRKK